MNLKHTVMKRLLISSAAMMLLTGSMLADGNISGSVFNKTTAQPIDFVSVRLVNVATGQILPLGTVTDEKGEFVIADVPSGKYLVRVSQVGSVTQEREVTVGDSNISLGKIELADDTKLLSEVVVTGEKSQMSVNAERRVFNVSSNIASSGASADELLAAVPSVDVNAEGEISLRGKSDVMVWINGKEMGMNADNRAQILRQIPAESIESIEVMTNPSSKHSTEGTAGIINIRLKENHQHGYFGNADANVDTRGSVNAGFNINYNEGKFESFAGLGLKSGHTPGGVDSRRAYDDGSYLNSRGKSRRHERSVFLRLGTNYNLSDRSRFYLSAIGSLGDKSGKVDHTHLSNLPGLWVRNDNHMKESGNNGGLNILAGFTHHFSERQSLDMNVSYNFWRGKNENLSHENETMTDGSLLSSWLGQRQNMKISNWEAAVDYSNDLLDWLRLEAGYKGNYNHENSPASYSSGSEADNLLPLNSLYNRFKYNTDITALYLNFSGSRNQLSFSAGLRGEAWQVRTRSLGYGMSDGDVPQFKNNDFALFPSASLGWTIDRGNELKLNYSRRIRRPFGPQLNTFENIADPSEVHLGNPELLPEYSNAVELSYLRNWSDHTLSVSGYMRSSTDMISHISFLAPMASDPDVNTMYYGHANVGNMVNTGVEIISRNSLFRRLTLTTTLNLYNSHLKAWHTEYPMHDSYFSISGRRQNRLVAELSCMASVNLPWNMTFQTTGRYNSRRVMAQGAIRSDWDVEAALRKNIGAWGVSLICKDIFNSKESREILYGSGYTQSIGKWSGGRTLRLAVSYTFGGTHDHNHSHELENHIDTGGYGEEHSHDHGHEH